MGQCSKATFSYGIVLKDEDIENLCDALGCEDLDDLWPAPLYSWLNSQDLAPFNFTAERKSMGEDSDGDNDDDELVISFVGRDDRESAFEVHELEIWGRDEGGTKIKSIPMPADKEFMVSAKEAFQKLKDSEAFKEAEITEIVPQWILTLSVG